MFRSLMTRTVAVALGLVGVLGFVADASAGYNIRVSYPGPSTVLQPNPLVITDQIANSGSQDNNPLLNIVEGTNNTPAPLMLNIPGGTLTFNQLKSNSVPGPANYLFFQYDVNYAGAGASGQIMIEFSRTGYTSTVGLNTLSATDSITFGTASAGSQQITNSYGSGNVDYGTGTDLVGTTKNSAGTQSFPDNLSTVFTTTGSSYTLTSKVILNFNSSGQFAGAGTISLSTAVPVPAGLVLALTGLPALGFFSRLRRRNVQA